MQYEYVGYSCNQLCMRMSGTLGVAAAEPLNDNISQNNKWTNWESKSKEKQGCKCIHSTEIQWIMCGVSPVCKYIV